jgi:hypothetical protein
LKTIITLDVLNNLDASSEIKISATFKNFICKI